jgi:hypothetical protein
MTPTPPHRRRSAIRRRLATVPPGRPIAIASAITIAVAVAPV